MDIRGQLAQCSHEDVLALHAVDPAYQRDHEGLLRQPEFESGHPLPLDPVLDGVEPSVIQTQWDDVYPGGFQGGIAADLRLEPFEGGHPCIDGTEPPAMV